MTADVVEADIFDDWLPLRMVLILLAEDTGIMMDVELDVVGSIVEVSPAWLLKLVPNALFCDCTRLTVEFGDAEYRELVVEDAESDIAVVICEAKLLVPVAEVLPNELPVWPTPPELKLDDCDGTKLEGTEYVETAALLIPVVLWVVEPPVVVLDCNIDTLETIVELLRLVC